MLKRLIIGRQAPVKRCLARCSRHLFRRSERGLAPDFLLLCGYCISFDRLKLKFLAVRLI
jgi:hypothetical protein